jgi:hypothetical protein
VWQIFERHFRVNHCSPSGVRTSWYPAGLNASGHSGYSIFHGHVLGVVPQADCRIAQRTANRTREAISLKDENEKTSNRRARALAAVCCLQRIPIFKSLHPLKSESPSTRLLWAPGKKITQSIIHANPDSPKSRYTIALGSGAEHDQKFSQ